MRLSLSSWVPESDWPTMQAAAQMCEALHIPHEALIVSAHRTPDRLA